MLPRASAVAVAITLVGACGSPGKVSGPGTGNTHAAWNVPADTPIELAEDEDLAHARGQFAALGPADPKRAPLRLALAREYAARIKRGFAQHQRRRAYDALLSMARLWHPADLQRPGERASLARFAASARLVRSRFARAGGDREATAALALLMEMDPTHAGTYRKEIDEIFVYADDLAVARFGDGAQRARPIKILESVVDAFPSSFVLTQLTDLYVQRQAAIDRHFKRRGANFPLIRAHGSSVLRTTWNIVRIHARARRIADAPRAIEPVHGLGDAPSLRLSLRLALSSAGTARNWLTLARAMRGDDEKETDLTASLELARAGLARFPGDARLLSYAADTARGLELQPLAIKLYRELARRGVDTHEDAQSLAELYDAHMGALLFRERPRAALAQLRVIEALHATASKRWPDSPLEPDLADAYATFGRGMVGMGELAQARHYLGKSVTLRPNQSALEFLATIALKQDQFRDASRLFDKALAVTGSDLTYRFNRAKILRLAAEAYGRGGDTQRHSMYSRAALSAWGDLTSEHDNLPPRYRAELFVESAKIMWGLGDKRAALLAFNTAIDADPDGAEVHAAVVSFLVGRDRYGEALDIYHRALGSEGISVYFKVYMSLWIVAEARRGGHQVDPLATEYLTGRRGRAWYDELARYATGRATKARLESRATTRARRAEMLYYTAALDPGADPQITRRQLEAVLSTDAVMFFEYDMAKQWLSRLRKASAARTTH